MPELPPVVVVNSSSCSPSSSGNGASSARRLSSSRHKASTVATHRSSAATPFCVPWLAVPETRRSSPRNVYVAAAASPRLVSTACPRRGTRRRRRDSSPRNVHVAAAAAPLPALIYAPALRSWRLSEAVDSPASARVLRTSRGVSARVATINSADTNAMRIVSGIQPLFGVPYRPQPSAPRRARVELWSSAESQRPRVCV